MIRPCDSRSLVRLIACTVLALGASALSALAAAPIGEVIAIGGSPEASGTGGERALGPGSALFEGDRVTTGYGNAQILFVDDTKLVVGPNSTLVIDRFLLRGDDRATKVSLDALRGTFRFVTGKSDKEAYEIDTGTATIGIRGTAFDFSSKMTTVVATFAGYVTLSTGGEQVVAGPHCDVVRAAFGNVGAYDGRAAGVLITNNLPYVTDQSALDPLFRLDTSDCDPKANLLEKGRRHNDRDSSGDAGRASHSGGNGGEGGGGSDTTRGGNSDPSEGSPLGSGSDGGPGDGPDPGPEPGGVGLPGRTGPNADGPPAGTGDDAGNTPDGDGDGDGGGVIN
jgi:hypothetical protein